MSIMEPVGKKKPRRPRREFTPEFKAQIVQACQRGDRTIAQVVVDFDLVDSAVRRWIAQADADADADPAIAGARLSVAEKAELAALRRENQQLRQDVDILKRATAFFAKETR
jgi:transposase